MPGLRSLQTAQCSGRARSARRRIKRSLMHMSSSLISYTRATSSSVGVSTRPRFWPMSRGVGVTSMKRGHDTGELAARAGERAALLQLRFGTGSGDARTVLFLAYADGEALLRERPGHVPVRPVSSTRD